MATQAKQIEFLMSENPDLALGTAEIYETGTTTPKIVYTDIYKTQPVSANPFDLDANGQAVRYVDGEYKIVLKNALGATVYTFDGIISATLADFPEGVVINEAQGTDIPSATTTDIGAATGNYVQVTGTTTITGLGTIQAGARRVVEFTGSLILTHNAVSLILPTAANITTASGDVAVFISLGSGYWKCISYDRYSGIPLTNFTGLVMDYVGATAPDGYVMLSGRTIGSAASSATERANVDTFALYSLLWNSMADAEAAVSGGRGATSAADFAANKTIALPDCRGRVIAGKDNMGGSAANRITVGSSGITGTTLGTSGGEQVHTLTEAQLAPHDHQLTTIQAPGSTAVVVDVRSDANTTRTDQVNTVSAGSGDAHQNTQPTIMLNKIVKL